MAVNRNRARSSTETAMMDLGIISQRSLHLSLGAFFYHSAALVGLIYKNAGQARYLGIT